MTHALFRYMVRYEDKENKEPVHPNLPPGVKLHIGVAHDESGFHVNDLKKSGWLSESQQVLRKKGRGRLLHVSDFIVEATGRLALNEEQVAANNAKPPEERLEVTDARRIIYPGKNTDPYWNLSQLMEQVSGFHEIHPGNLDRVLPKCRFRMR